jgi:3-hydroxymyristoyl/3-hydroxydecanoyl-(acyl carrier protein) dehydratase
MGAKQSSMSVSADHPALPGHFPGQPIVPASLILNAVVSAIQASNTGSVTSIAKAKFSSPLRPGQQLTIEIKQRRDIADFKCLCGTRLVASGTIVVADGR